MYFFLRSDRDEVCKVISLWNPQKQGSTVSAGFMLGKNPIGIYVYLEDIYICIYSEEFGNMGEKKNICTGLVIIKSTVLCSNIEK